MQIEGRNPILEALRAETPLQKILIEKNIKKDQKILEIIQLAKKNRLQIQEVKKYLLDKKSETRIHQGIIAIGKNIETPSFSKLIIERDAFIIYIREALYEHNIGAIIRTAECLGATGVILPPKTAITPQIRRASMGASEHIPVTNYNLFQAIKEAKETGLEIIAIERNENSTPLPQYKFKLPIMLIIGGEDRSLSKEILNKCDGTVEIPMTGKVNSLNMSVAAAIVIYEVSKQLAAKS